MTVCGLCKQVEQSEPGDKLDDMAEGTNKEEVTMVIQLMTCQEENENLCHHIMQVEAAHYVS